MSPKSGGRAQRRQRRNLLISVLVVVAIAIGSFGATVAAKWSPRLGLDLAGGVAVVYTAVGHDVTQADMNETVNILNLRVNGLGVSGAQVQATGKNQISVSIPGVTNAQQVLNQIGQTARMYFRPVECYAYPEATPKHAPKNYVPPRGTVTVPPCAASSQITTSSLNVQPNANVPAGFTSNNVPPDSQYVNTPSTSVLKPNYENSTVLLPAVANGCGGGGARCVLGPSEMSGHDIANAQATQNQTGAWVVDYTLNGSAGSTKWDQVSEQNFHLPLGIELDGNVYSAPIIQPTQGSWSSFQGRGEISGSLTQQDAQNLAQAMNYGALPITLRAATSETVSATLGHSALGHTSVAPSFDLAGITGLIVSIGITVDSYIVYFERLKDETRAGRSVRTSVDRGFKSAWRTVWAADFVSLIAAIVLYLVAVGNVKGFAFFLGLSTIMDMAVTWFYTRPLVILLGQSQRLAGEGAFSIATGLGVGRGAEGAGGAGVVPVGVPTGAGGGGGGA